MLIAIIIGLIIGPSLVLTALAFAVWEGSRPEAREFRRRLESGDFDNF